MRAPALVAAIAAAAVLACGRAPGPGAEASAPVAAAAPAAPPTSRCPPRRTVAIRVQLAGAPARAARLTGIEAWADDAPLEVGQAAGPVALVGGEGARVGTIDLPASARRIAVSLAVATEGAAACSAPIRFEADASALERRCEAVVALDVARSVVALEDGTRQLLPQFSVAY